MTLLYITYRQNGTLKKGTVKQQQYEALQNDSSITELTIHPNSRLMEQAFNEARGANGSSKRVLHG